MSVNLKDFAQIQADYNAAYFGNVAGQPTAVTARMGSAFALLLDEFYAALGEMQARFYVGTATGDDLDQRVSDFGITRVPAAVATIDILRFFTASPATSAILIPAGTAAQRADGVRYLTAADATIPPGGLSIDVAATCEVAGAIGNTLPDTITILSSPPSGISRVTNPSTVNNGKEQQSDAELKQYTAEYLASLARGTLSAVLVGTKSVPGITSASIFEDRYARALLYVLISDASGTASPTLIDLVRTTLDDWRPAGCKLKISGSTRLTMTVGITYALLPGYEARQSEVEANLVTAAINYVNGHKIGEGVYHDPFISVLNNVEGVAWASLTCPATDTAVKFYERVYTDGGHVTTSKSA